MTRKIANFLLGLGFAGFCAYLAFKGVDTAELGAELKTVNYLRLSPYGLFFVLMLTVRAFRWGILLKPMGRVGTGRVFAISQVGFMAILFMPLRIGELVRPYLVSQESDIPMSKALATIVVERIVDGLSVGFLLALSVLVMGRERLPAEVIVTCYLLLGGFTAAALFLILLIWKKSALVSVISAVVGRVSQKAAQIISETASSFLTGVATIPDVRNIAFFFGLTAFYWVFNGLAMYGLMLAFGFGNPPYEIPIASGFVTMAILVGFIMLPTAPAFVGNFEAAVVFSLNIFGIADTPAMSYALVLHATQTVLHLLIGSAFLLSGSVSLSKTLKAAGLRA